MPVSPIDSHRHWFPPIGSHSHWFFHLVALIFGGTTATTTTATTRTTTNNNNASPPSVPLNIGGTSSHRVGSPHRCPSSLVPPSVAPVRGGTTTTTTTATTTTTSTNNNNGSLPSPLVSPSGCPRHRGNYNNNDNSNNKNYNSPGLWPIGVLR